MVVSGFYTRECHPIFSDPDDHKLAITVLFFAACFLVVVVVTFLVTPNYQATAQVLVKLGRDNVYIPETGNVNPVVNLR
jgi:hypothetical protein